MTYLNLIGSFRPVIPVIHYIRNYVIRDMSLCIHSLYMSLRIKTSASGDWGGWVNSGRACLRILVGPNY